MWDNDWICFEIDQKKGAIAKGICVGKENGLIMTLPASHSPMRTLQTTPTTWNDLTAQSV